MGYKYPDNGYRWSKDILKFLFCASTLPPSQHPTTLEDVKGVKGSKLCANESVLSIDINKFKATHKKNKTFRKLGQTRTAKATIAINKTAYSNL